MEVEGLGTRAVKVRRRSATSEQLVEERAGVVVAALVNGDEDLAKLPGQLLEAPRPLGVQRRAQRCLIVLRR